MTAFLLVHGGSHGGWCWRRVAAILRARGHEVYTPTLTGVGERAHLVSDTVGVSTHVRDLVAVVDAEELDDVVVVAHSYGGLPASGLLDLRGDRCREAVFLDAMIGRSGEAAFDGLDPGVVAEKLAGAQEHAGVKVLAPLPAALYGLSRPDDIAWADRHVTAQPAATYLTPLHLDHPVGAGRPCRYVRCTTPALSTIDRHESRARMLGWPVTGIAAGHDAMISEPELVAGVLAG